MTEIYFLFPFPLKILKEPHTDYSGIHKLAFKTLLLKSLPSSLCLLPAGKRYPREEKCFPF